MDSEKNKIWMGWLAFSFIVVHFLLIIAYAMPDTLGSKSLKQIATPYVEPIFTQKWAMFAPCPIVNANVEVKFQFKDGDSTGWMSPTKDAREKHAWYRMSHHGELVLGEANLIFWLGLDLDKMNIAIGDQFPTERLAEFQKGYSYFKIKNYLKGNALYFYDKAIDMAQIRFDLEDVVTAKKGGLTLPPFYY